MVLSLFFLAFWLTVSIYFWIRNKRVHDFRNNILDTIFTQDNYVAKLTVYQNGPSYQQMMLSFKPVRLDSFYTPEQIKILFS